MAVSQKQFENFLVSNAKHAAKIMSIDTMVLWCQRSVPKKRAKEAGRGEVLSLIA